MRVGEIAWRTIMNRICCIACLAATAVGIVGRASGTPFSGEDAYVRVTGGLPEIRIYGDRRVYIFTNTSEAAEIAVKTRLTLEEYLVVGGGGAGGHSIGGGGGGGGVVYSNEAQVVESGGTLSVTVGAGGRQKPGATWKSGGSGGHSVLGIAGKSIVAYGGGGGGGRALNSGKPEAAVIEKEIGSGGGAVGSSVGTENQQWNPNQGNPGGTGGAGGSKTDGGGGGGGADEGAVGGSNSSVSAGNGGEGLAFDLTGETVVYGSGGGGGTRYDAHDAGKGGTNAGDGRRGLAGALDSRELVRAESGVDGTGGGGGGGGAPASGSGADLNGEGGDGGCGTVVLVFTEGDHRVSRFGIAEIGDCIYPGRDVTPAVTVMNSAGEVLSPETDYTVAYRDNDAPGTAVAIATGRDGTPYAGFSAIRPFTILAAAYSDDLIVASDATVRRLKNGKRIAYVITNASESVVVQTKRKLKLREYLVVGGGGAGGHSIGGGGGGGGVVHSNAVQLMESGSALYVSVGAGGRQKPGATWKSGGSGGHTVLDFAGQRIVAYGGGGGRSYNNGVPEAAVVEKEIGSGGGAVGGSVGAVDQQWNPKQGNPGGTGGVGDAGGNGGGGGGGGAGAGGGSYTFTAAGDGGEGLAFDIVGERVVYGSGGGGGTRSNKQRPGKGGTNAGDGREGGTDELVCAESGVDGTGGGGGGGGAPIGGAATDLNAEGGDGGCGTVILVFTECAGLSVIVR